jgi:hypothetical protein
LRRIAVRLLELSPTVSAEERGKIEGLINFLERKIYNYS